MSHITRISPRRPIGMERSIARSFRADQADLVCRGLFHVAETAEPPARQRIIHMAYAEGAKADVLRALADGHHREARAALSCWRALHRNLTPKREGRA